MARISLLVKVNRDGIARLADESQFRIDPDQLEYTAEWSPGTEIVIMQNENDQEWQYKLMSSGGGIPVHAAPHTASP